MKQQSNTKQILAVAAIVIITAAAGASVPWMTAGVLGLAVVSMFAKRAEPKLAPVRIRSQRAQR